MVVAELNCYIIELSYGLLIIELTRVVTIRDLHHFLLSLLRPSSVPIFRSHITTVVGIPPLSLTLPGHL